MDLTLRNQQGQWRESNRRLNPASEGELLDLERELGDLVKKTRLRILGMFSFKVNEVSIPVHELLPDQKFQGVTIVGAVSTLLGQEGLLAQGLWYSPDADFDWYWAEITDPLTIEVREDNRFRGGTRCIWITTSIAEYAVAMPHPTYIKHWESTLTFFNAPPLDAWPRHDYRPDWWPAESAGLWPGKKRPEELPHAVTRVEEVRRLTETLSVNPPSSLSSWRRLGHYGDNRFPGQPQHHLFQLQAWELTYDGGIKITRDQAGESSARLQEEDGEEISETEGKKRKKSNRGWRRGRWRHSRYTRKYAPA